MHRLKLLLILYLAPVLGAPLLAQPVASVPVQQGCNRFVGTVQAQWEGDRNMRLTGPFSFIDPSCKRWDVPADTVVDGASIPRAFWTLIGGPFEGAYRESSVVHDYYCVRKTRNWRSVHKMFYEGMLASGTDPVKAKLMYYAVLVGGPRWKLVTYSNHPPRMFPEPGDTDETKVVAYAGTVDTAQVEADLERIKIENLSTEQIEALAEQKFNGAVPPEVVRTDR